MSVSNLPEELLQQIFTSGLKQYDYPLLSLASKQFNAIVKPLLYRSITISSLRQANKFSDATRKEDGNLVRSIKIRGKAGVQEEQYVRDFAKAYMEMGEDERMGQEAGCVQKVLEGKLVNPALLEAIVIEQVVEDPNEACYHRPSGYELQVFRNLKDVSIFQHRGGDHLLLHFLQRRYLPALERLAVFVVSQFGLYEPTFRRGGTEAIPLSPDELEYQECMVLEQSDLWKGSNLKLLVSPAFTSLSAYSSFTHLAIISAVYPPSSYSKYAVLYVPQQRAWKDDFAIEMFLGSISANPDRYSLKYLAVPSYLNWSSEYTEYHLVFIPLEKVGVKIQFDADVERPVVPPSFFKFRQKEEENAKSKGGAPE